MKKFLVLAIVLFMMNLTANAKKMSPDFNAIIKDSGIKQSAIAISVKNVDTGKSIYTQNDKILLHPASVQKILTIVPIMDILGEDYKFTTSLYTRGKSQYILKLGADPYLRTSDLGNLVKKIDAENIKKLYIDDYIIERKDWGEGWQWDDDLNPAILRFNSYNLDNNIARITVMPTQPNKSTNIINQSKYPFVFINNSITAKENNIAILRENLLANNVIKVEGTVNSPVIKIFPLNNLKGYFDYKLVKTLEDNKIYLKDAFIRGKITESDVKIADISHSVDIAVNDVLKNSNNMVIETMFKLAGGKLYNKEGTDKDGINLFYAYCKKHNLDCSEIKIVDASGVSKNNLVNSDFVTEYLIMNKDNTILYKMASPGEGTLSNRMLPLKDNLKAKTGTLSDIRSIAGFLTSKNGNKYVFCIMINDPTSSSSDKKNLEDYLIREIYLKL